MNASYLTSTLKSNLSDMITRHYDYSLKNREYQVDRWIIDEPDPLEYKINWNANNGVCTFDEMGQIVYDYMNRALHKEILEETITVDKNDLMVVLTGGDN